MGTRRMTTPNTNALYHVGRRSYRVPEIAHRNGVSRAFVYKQIAEGRLRARKAGAATIVTDEDEAAWIGGMPDLVALNAADASADK
jgi:hypothetical protein